MARRPPAALADYLIVGINPALIMLLIGSLVFFLLAIFYRGEYDLRVSFIFAMFIMGAVAVGRISMEEGTGYASMFGGPLAAATLVALIRFVHFSGPLAAFGLAINIGLIALIWFLAYQLTWDCTLIDDQADTSDQGLLEAVGVPLEADDDARAEAPELEPPPLTGLERYLPPEEKEEESPPWMKWFERSKRPHAHGIWVIYFSILALPAFGLGQLFLPADSRGYAFSLLVVYVAAALALLMSTSFLGLRRYLRKRRLEMPLDMTATWLMVGGGIIAAVLVLCLLIPRPGSEMAISQLPPITINSGEQSPNRHSVGNDGQEADEQARAGSQKSQSDGSPGQAKSNDGSQPGGQSDQNSGGQSQSDGQSNGSQQGSNQQNGNQQSESQGQSSADRQEQNNHNQGSQSDSSAGNQGNGSTQNQAQQTSQTNQQAGSESSDAQQAQSSGSSSGSSAASEQRSTSSPASTSQPSQPLNVGAIASSLGNLVKWIIYLVIAAIIAFLMWKYRRELAVAWQQLLKELAELWARLFGGSIAIAATQHASVAAPMVRRPFASYRDPFATGEAARMQRSELLRYTFEALQAWGRENRCEREVSETPHEYTQRVGMSSPHLAREAMLLADYYGLAAYAGTGIGPEADAPLRSLWRKMQPSPMAVLS
jgi:hypothetical protein